MVSTPQIGLEGKIKGIYSKYKYFFSSSIIVLINGLASVFNYISFVYINRNLSIEDFAQYNAIVNIVTIIALTLSSYGYFIVQDYNKKNQNEEYYWTYSYIFTLSISLIFLFSIPLMPIIFNINSYTSLIIATFFIFFSILTITSQSLLRASGYINIDYTTHLISIFIVKILLLAIFILTGFTLLKSMIILSVCNILIFSMQIFYMKKLSIKRYASIKSIKENYSFDALKDIIIKILPILIINFIFNSLFGFDVLMSKRYLSDYYAGYYSTMSMIAKMFFYIGSAVSLVMYSYNSVAIKEKNIKKENTIVISSVVLLTILSLILSVILIIFAKPFILIQFTEKYSDLIKLMPYSVFFGISLVFAVFVFHYFLCYKIYKPFYFYLVLFFITYIFLRNSERTFEVFITIFKYFYLSLLLYNTLIFLVHRIRKRIN